MTCGFRVSPLHDTTKCHGEMPRRLGDPMPDCGGLVFATDMRRSREGCWQRRGPSAGDRWGLREGLQGASHAGPYLAARRTQRESSQSASWYSTAYLR